MEWKQDEGAAVRREENEATLPDNKWLRQGEARLFSCGESYP
jgi:hypothetical protein